MAQLSPGDLTTITTFPYHAPKFLSVCPRTVLYSGQINGDPTLDTISGGVISFNIDNTSGDEADCIPGMTIDIGTTAGARDVGQFRLRKTIFGETIYVSETAFADVGARDNYYFSVVQEFKPAIKMLRLLPITSSGSRIPDDFIEYHDYDEVYSNGNVAIKPCANITHDNAERFPPRYAGMLDDGQSYRTVTLSCAFSEFLNSGETKTSQTWWVDDCAISVGSTSSEDITIQAPEGYRYISCTIVGSSGGRQTIYIPIWAHGDTFTPFSSSVRGFEITEDETDGPGRRMTFAFRGQENAILDSDIPLGTPYCYWENPEFNGITAPDQYRRQFYGWSSEREVSTSVEDAIDLKIDGIGYWMDSFDGFSIQIEDVGKTPNKHFYMQNMTVDKVAHYILREFTNVPNLVNIYLSGNTVDTSKEKIPKESVFGQINDFIASFKNQLKCDTSGAFWMRKNPNLMDAGEEYDTGLFYTDERASLTTIATITDSMILRNGVTIKEKDTKPLGRVDAVGSLDNGAGNEPDIFASRAPGKVLGRSPNSQPTPFIRLSNSEDYAFFELNYVSGRYYAKGIDFHQGIEIQLAGNLDVFEPAWGEVVKLDISPSNANGLTFDPTDLYEIRKVSINHSNQVGQPRKQITLTVDRVTNGDPGVNIPVEDLDWLNNPFFDLYYSANSVIPPRQPSTPQLDTFNDEIVDLAIVGEGDSDKVARTFVFSRAEPVWEDITPGSVPGTRALAMVDGRFDGTTLKIKALYYEGTTYEIYNCGDALQETPSWSLEQSGTLSGTNPEAPILVADKESDFFAVAWLSDDGVRITRKTTGAWTSPEVVGGSFASTVSGQLLGMALRNGAVVICGATAADEYGLYWAENTGSFSAVLNSQTMFGPANSIKIDDSGNVYVSSYSDDAIITPSTTPWGFLTSSNLLIDNPSATADGNKWYIPSASFQIGAQLQSEWYFDGTLASDIQWEPEWSGIYGLTSFNGSSYIAPKGDFTITLTWTVYTNNVGEFEFIDEIRYVQAQDDTGATYIGVISGPIYQYRIEPSGNSIKSVDMLQNLPEDAEVTYIKADAVISGSLIPATAGSGVIDWQFRQEDPNFDYDSVNTNTSRFWRIENYQGVAPTWNAIIPTDGYIPEQFNSITLDAQNETLMSYHGAVNSALKQWIFTAEGGDRRLGTSGQEYKSSKISGPIFLSIGDNALKFSLDRIPGLESKLGDLATVLSVTTPNILNAIVLFGG